MILHIYFILDSPKVIPPPPGPSKIADTGGIYLKRINSAENKEVRNKRTKRKSECMDKADKLDEDLIKIYL